MAPGLQVPPEGTPDKEANLPSELNTPQPHLNRAHSITSAVDYEYFDVGIGQVVLKLPSSLESSPQNKTLSYLILTPVDFGSGDFFCHLCHHSGASQIGSLILILEAL